MVLTTKEDVALTIGLDISKLPTPVTTNYIDAVITKVEEQLEDKLGTTFDTADTFSETVSSKYLDAGRVIRLGLKNISNIKVYERLYVESSWRQLSENYDYDIDYNSGLIIMHNTVIPKFNLVEGDYNDIKVEGSYGGETPTQAHKDLARILSAINILITIYGIDIAQKSVEGFSLGDFTSNVRALTGTEGNSYLITLEDEKNKLLEEVGLINSKRKIKYKII